MKTALEEPNNCGENRVGRKRGHGRGVVGGGRWTEEDVGLDSQHDEPEQDDRRPTNIEPRNHEETKIAKSTN
jgi:hypothetical protein